MALLQRRADTGALIKCPSGNLMSPCNCGPSCDCTLTPNPLVVPGDADTHTVTVNMPIGVDCDWYPDVQPEYDTWLSVTQGIGEIYVDVTQNDGAPRTGFIDIMVRFTGSLDPYEVGCTLEVQQSTYEPCSCNITSITPNPISAAGETVTVHVTTSKENCDWTAEARTADCSWSSPCCGTSGTGSGDVDFVIPANTGPECTVIFSFVMDDGGGGFCEDTATQESGEPSGVCSYWWEVSWHPIDGWSAVGCPGPDCTETCDETAWAFDRVEGEYCYYAKRTCGDACDIPGDCVMPSPPAPPADPTDCTKGVCKNYWEVLWDPDYGWDTVEFVGQECVVSCEESDWVYEGEFMGQCLYTKWTCTTVCTLGEPLCDEGTPPAAPGSPFECCLPACTGWSATDLALDNLAYSLPTAVAHSCDNGCEWQYVEEPGKSWASVSPLSGSCDGTMQFSGFSCSGFSGSPGDTRTKYWNYYVRQPGCATWDLKGSFTFIQYVPS